MKHDKQLIGYAIEYRYWSTWEDQDHVHHAVWSNWMIHWNSKIYSSKGVVNESLEKMRKYHSNKGNNEFRAIPIYKITAAIPKQDENI